MELGNTFHTEVFAQNMRSCKSFAILGSIVLSAGIFSAIIFPQFIFTAFVIVAAAFALLLIILFFKFKIAEKAFLKPLNELQQHNLRFSTLIKNAPFVVMQFGSDGTLLHSNIKNKFPESELSQSQSVYNFLVPESKELLTRIVGLVFERKTPETTNEIHWLFSSEVSRFHSTILAPIIENGNVASIIAIITDITDNEQLREQLLRIQKLETVSILAAGIAHDFNNTMNLINLLSERALRSHTSPEAVQDSITKIQSTVIQASGIIKKLLDLNKNSQETSLININDIISDFQPLLRKIIDHDTLFEVKFDDPITQIYGNEIQIKQIITNLVINARDAMREKTRGSSLKKITIETKTVIYNGTHPSMITLSISDTGIGINKECQKKIFEPFYTTKGSERGTGLGLTMVHNIVQQLNGSIHVSSEEGKGTTFTIGFPIVVSQNGSDGKLEQQRQINQTVVVVEDNSDTLFLLVKYLKSAGFTVVTFQSENLFHDWISTHSNTPDVLITDFYLVDTNGKAIIELFRSYHPERPIILTSGYSLDQLDICLEEYGNIIFIQKPFSARQLIDKITEFIFQPNLR